MIPLNQNLTAMKRSGIRAFTELARQTPDCRMLTIGEPDFDTPAPIRAAAAAALDRGETHYAPNQGVAALRQAIAQFETRRGNPTEAAQVLVTAAATQALFTALMGILNPGEEVVVPTPAFPLYESIITAVGGKMRVLDLTRTGFQITGEALASVITPRTKAIVLNSPNNPTGTVLNRQSLEAVKKAVLGKDIFLICDNVYSALSYGDCPDITLDPVLKEQVLLCQSFSKPYAMTGWRVGYLVCPEYVMDRLLLLSATMIAAVPTFLQSAALEALNTDPTAMVETYRARRDYVCRRLDGMGLVYPKPEGAFYVFPDISRFGMDSAGFCERMIREGRVAAVPGSCFGAEGYIRLSYCCSDRELAEGLDRMEAFLKNL